jgi:hypothetical protein
MSCAVAPGRDAAKGRPYLETLDPLAGEEGEPPDPAAARIASGGQAVYAKENRPDEAGEIPVSRHRSAPRFYFRRESESFGTLVKPERRRSLRR